MSGANDHILILDRGWQKRKQNAAVVSSPDYLLRWVCFSTTFLSAFLLFQIQPLVAKAILPWFGGSPALWTTCMLFFQTALLAGYAYAHLLTQCLRPTTQVFVHSALVVSALVVLPIEPSETWRPDGYGNPVWNILGVLTASVAAPFIILSATAPLLQHWWSRATADSPYRLYAISNTGSVLALISYPFLIEPFSGIRTQSTVWSTVFVFMAVQLVGCGILFIQSISNGTTRAFANSRGHECEKATELERPSIGRRLLWLIYATCGSALLLALTSHICQDVAVVPFLWVAPLGMYLWTFIMCFGNPRWYHRGLWGALMFASMLICSWMYRAPDQTGFVAQLAAHLVAILAGCMVCHGELVRARPPAHYLTIFYLYVAAGGALGGAAVSLLAPAVFFDYFEYPLVLAATWLLFLAVLFFDKSAVLRRGRPLWAWGLLAAGLIVLVANLSQGIQNRHARLLKVSRNFFGVLSIVVHNPDSKDEMSLVLRHGLIQHGAQYLDQTKKQLPTTYYRESSGVGKVFRATESRHDRKVGVIGLGVGTVAAYGRRSDQFIFYEIDPDVVECASRYFSFLKQSRERGVEIDVVPGDARLSLKNQAAQNFDVLIVDAFTGDAIPTHLLTREAFQTYLRHLRGDGIIALHISNRHLDLVPLATAVADHFELEMAEIIDWEQTGDKSSQKRRMVSQWVLLAPEGHLAGLHPSSKNTSRVGHARRTRLWTDDFSNVFALLR